jgi:hypothetical protein
MNLKQYNQDPFIVKVLWWYMICIIVGALIGAFLFGYS